jgi:cytochrome c oxidase subunit I
LAAHPERPPGWTRGIHVVEYHAQPTGLKRWLTTCDHKDIGLLYFWFSLVGFVVGGLLAVIIRLELMDSTGNTFVYDETYNVAVTLHAISMIFLFIMPLFAGFGNYFVPLQIGAKDMAFPRINALGFWILIPGALFVWSGVIVKVFFPRTDLLGKLPQGGWTMYAPLNGVGCGNGLEVCFPGIGTDLMLMGLHILGISSILGAINFIVTIVKERKPGMGWHDISLFSWSILTMAILLAFGTPTLTVALTMLLFDRNFATSFFVPQLGGDALMWQHLFWFFGHPEVYILILPAFGIISEVLPRMARKPIFGYHAIAYSTIAIGVFGFMVWVHHMFTTGISPYFRAVFMAMTFAIGVPTGVKIFNWLATLWHGQIIFRAPMLFVIGFLSMFVIGGINGVFTASIPIDFNLQDTYWVVSHIHYVLFGGSVLAIFAGIYYWFPRMSGRMYNESLARWHFALSMIGLNIVFFTMHFLGLRGMPRRYATYEPALEQMNLFASIGAFILAFATLLFFINLFWSWRRGAPAPADPWRAGPKALEWKTMPRVRAPATPMPYEAETAPGAETVKT